MSVIEKYATTIDSMEKESQIAVQVSAEAYAACQKERRKLEVRLEAVEVEKQKQRWQFIKVACKLFLLMLKPKEVKIEQAMTPVNEYLNYSNMEKVLKAQILKAEDSEKIAQKELEDNKNMQEKIRALKG